MIPTLVPFEALVAAPGPRAVTDPYADHRPGEVFLSGMHGGAVVTGQWLALTPTVAVPCVHRSHRTGQAVFGWLELADGRATRIPIPRHQAGWPMWEARLRVSFEAGMRTFRYYAADEAAARVYADKCAADLRTEGTVTIYEVRALRYEDEASRDTLPVLVVS